MTQPVRDEFLLDPGVHFLNHGSFGACPVPVFAEYQRWQLALERQPVAFMQQRLHDELKVARDALGAYLNVPGDDLVYVDNATWGINVIARSMRLQSGDEVLTTDHEYGACAMTWELLLGKQGATMVGCPIQLPVTSHGDFVEHFWSAVTPRTKVIYLSHLTSPTALIFPVTEICRRAREAGILTVIDGAHVPGQLPLDLAAVGADVYAGNLHKWLCAPKGSGFLYVRPEHQPWVESLVVSWGWGRTGSIEPDTTFVERNEWQGTRDYSAFLSVPAAIRFQEERDWPAVRARCHELVRQARSRVAELTGLPPICPDNGEWFAQLATIPFPTADAADLKRRLLDDFRIEIPVITWGGQTFVRISIQAYNDTRDVDALVTALSSIGTRTR